MKIHVLGGGPAGLYFALLMRQLGHDLTVWERNPAGATFGWGVVFSGQTLSYLEKPDPLVHQRMMAEVRVWENVDVVHRGELVSVAGNRFAGIARLALLRVLQERCGELGVRLHFEHEVGPLGDYLDCDLLVAADGVHSATRNRLSEAFQPDLEEGRNRYIWLGTRQPFGGLTLIFRPRPEGLFMAHAYKYSADMSTFIVEVDERTWDTVARWDEQQSVARLQEIFADDLGGNELMSNASRWIRFTRVKNRHWWTRHEGVPVVLLGDALHTAHFSIGSGTKLAMEDAISLWQCYREDAPEPLAEFERRRRPDVERLQSLAEASQHWFETAREKMPLDVVPFVYEAMTRSSKIDEENLARRDPAFVERYRKSLG